MLLCSRQPFVTDSTGPLGSSQSAGSDIGSLLFWVVSQCTAGGSMQAVNEISYQVYIPMLSHNVGLKRSSTGRCNLKGTFHSIKNKNSFIIYPLLCQSKDSCPVPQSLCSPVNQSLCCPATWQTVPHFC